GYDGRLTEHDAKLIENHVKVVETSQQAAKGAHAVVILTEWDEFKTVCFEDLHNEMNKPAFIFDGRSILKDHDLQEKGFVYQGIGF
ncbi:MAG: UDP binding domain-containing protein, partial [Planctomycetota bacterium]|nr:UDP binding domain-containing protein [Planctomycetota bacterium]